MPPPPPPPPAPTAPMGTTITMHHHTQFHSPILQEKETPCKCEIYHLILAHCCSLSSVHTIQQLMITLKRKKTRPLGRQIMYITCGIQRSRPRRCILLQGIESQLRTFYWNSCLVVSYILREFICRAQYNMSDQ